jgi:hypothetical protein
MNVATCTSLHLLLFLLLFGSFWRHVQSQGKIPCQTSSNKAKSSACEKVTLPTGFCHACGVNAPLTSAGNYVNCKYTSGFETIATQTNQQCLALFENYVSTNPCDTARSTALNLFRSAVAATREDGRQQIDYFVYAVCENGCDCIPQVNVNPSVLSIDPHRGNCQAHTYYDICRIFPQIKLVRGAATVDGDVTRLPAVCPLITSWFRQDGANFRSKPYTPVVPAVEYFVNRLVEAEELIAGSASTNVLWNECLTVELAQKRITAISTPPSPTSLAPVPAPTIPTLGVVTSFTLIRADTGAEVATLTPNYAIKLSVVGNKLSIRANTSGTVGKVVFGLDSNASFQTETRAPYALAGNSNAVYTAATQLTQVGSHTVVATPYSSSGTMGTSVAIAFSVF